MTGYTESTIGIVWQCQLCAQGLVLHDRLHRIHIWHCLTMPIVHPLVLRTGLRKLHNWHCLAMPIVHTGLVWSKLRPLISLVKIKASYWLRVWNPAFSLVEIHSWHSSKGGTFIYFWCIICIAFNQTMPFWHAMPFIWARQCQMCRQCHFFNRQCQECMQCHICC